MRRTQPIKPPANALRLPKVALAISTAEYQSFLGSRGDRLTTKVELVNQAGAPPDLDQLIKLQPDVLITAWSTPSLEKLFIRPACEVRYICHLTGSVRSVVPRSFIERGGLVTNWGALANVAVAEHALLLALATLRNLPAWNDVIAGPRNVSATSAIGTRSLAGRKVGIHGFGGVAQALVRLLQPLSVSISSYSAGVPADFMRKRGAEPCHSLADLFAGSEVVFECEALTPKTRHSVSASVLALLPENAVFVNVARGDLVDETALVKEASSGRIRVALDVIASEPLTPQSPVSGIRGALLSPHIAGPTLDLYPRIGDVAVANLERYAAGKPLQDLITLEVFDRST
jgi:phosphoglycerate dehydrogenase-like enzyme